MHSSSSIVLVLTVKKKKKAGPRTSKVIAFLLSSNIRKRVFNHLYLVGIKGQTQEFKNRLKSLGRRSFKCGFFPGAPSAGPGLAPELSVTCSTILDILLNPRHWPCLPCSTGNFPNRKNDGSYLLPQQNHNLDCISDLCAGLLLSNSRQSCIFLSLIPSLKQALLKPQCSAFTTLVMLQKEFNKFSKPVGLLGGAQIGSPQTDRNQCVNFNFEENRRYFSSITCCLTELREEPKNSNSSHTPSTQDHAASYLDTNQQTIQNTAWQLEAFSEMVPVWADL